MTPRVPVILEVLVRMPTDFFHCLHCEQVFSATGIGAVVRWEAREEYPADMLEEARRLSAWLQDLALRYGEQLCIRVIDQQSPEGFYKSLRHWVRRSPTFIVNGCTKHSGWDLQAVERLLADCGGTLRLT
jgi:hypothetical protein